MPHMPVKAAGWRIEPPVSLAVAARHSRAETAEAEPPDDPPGTSRPRLSAASAARPCAALQFGGSQGEATGPYKEASSDEPIANSSMLSLPSITAPSRQSCAVTVDS